jgi:hypothetical protein
MWTPSSMGPPHSNHLFMHVPNIHHQHCRWALNPSKFETMDDTHCSPSDPLHIQSTLVYMTLGRCYKGILILYAQTYEPSIFLFRKVYHPFVYGA